MMRLARTTTVARFVTALLALGLFSVSAYPQAKPASKPPASAVAPANPNAARAAAIFSGAFELLSAGELSAAEIQFKKGLELEPGNGLAHYYLGETQTRLNKFEDAKSAYSKVIELIPDSKEAALAQAALDTAAATARKAEDDRKSRLAVAARRETELREERNRIVKGATASMGLLKLDWVDGTGMEASKERPVVVHYTGWLHDPTKPDGHGRKFDSSIDRGSPAEFLLNQVIPGWALGISGMRVGGKRTLVIPPELGYGSHGAGATIPPNATLVFDIELLRVR